MRCSASSLWLLAVVRSFAPAFAQTSTACNPLQGTCPADPALGKSITIDFTSGASNEFNAIGAPTYNSDGANLAVAQSGDSPTLTSKWYMQFGNVEVVMKPAPGVGIVSSMVLQSDDLDEIDFEWLGADGQQVQSNYFGKGQTLSYNRGAFHPNPGAQTDFHTYTIDWTADQVVWQIDGTTVRALTPETAEPNQYPQTPMQLKLGIWSGGDPSNAPGTIQWAGGPTDYSGGPYTMVVKSIKATDYSTGTEYTYSDTSGTWQSIRSNGGQINPSGSGSGSGAAAAAPQVTDVSSGAPAPFDPSHADPSSTVSRPSVWPWVPSATTLQPAATQAGSAIPGLPSGWTVTPSGKVVPPSAAPSTSPPNKPSSSRSWPSAPDSTPAAAQGGQSGSGGSGMETAVAYDGKGFPTTVVRPAGWESASKAFDEQGFLVTPAPVSTLATSYAGRNVAVDQSGGTGSGTAPANPVATGAASAPTSFAVRFWGVVSCVLAGMMLL